MCKDIKDYVASLILAHGSLYFPQLLVSMSFCNPSTPEAQSPTLASSHCRRVFLLLFGSVLEWKSLMCPLSSVDASGWFSALLGHCGSLVLSGAHLSKNAVRSCLYSSESLQLWSCVCVGGMSLAALVECIFLTHPSGALIGPCSAMCHVCACVSGRGLEGLKQEMKQRLCNERSWSVGVLGYSSVFWIWGILRL